MKNLIAISGKAGSGKDTVTKIIQILLGCQRYTYKQLIDDPDVILNDTGDHFLNDTSLWVNVKFADSLKFITAHLFNLQGSQDIDRAFKEEEVDERWWYRASKGLNYVVRPTGRDYLLDISSALKSVNPQIFIHSLFSRFSGDRSRWIISDLRHLNELGYIENAHEPLVIRVERPCEFSAGDCVDVKVFSNWTNKATYIKYQSDKNAHLVIDNLGQKLLCTKIRPHCTVDAEIELDDVNFVNTVFNTSDYHYMIQQVREILQQNGFFS